MKKEYIQPSIKARKVYPSHMICESLVKAGEYSSESVTTLSKGGSGWLDDEEEDY